VTETTLDPEFVTVLAPFRRALRRASEQLARPLPWIGLDDPWAILVSEVMLQQTSTTRVQGPWRAFLGRFPDPEACASAPLAEVLRYWSGLGYPRRAKSLHETARIITQRHAGRVPHRLDELLALPGVGSYTANAVASFAFHQRVAVLDTNVGRVLARAVANRPLSANGAQALAAALLPRDRVAVFNQSMLDLGAQFCRATPRCEDCPLRDHCRWRRDGGEDPAPRSAAVSRPQSRFAGSDRQVRGRIMKSVAKGPRSPRELSRELADLDAPRVSILVDALVREGLLERRRGLVALSGDEA
jgi:A/G-specific adenine glycosylase